jgi:ABC-type nitrate/sulfonate/bicarbonate transport system ATPase subunit
VLELAGLTAVHDDGTLGVQGVDLTVRRGELVLLLGPIGAGKSSLLAALAGLVDHSGGLRWNGHEIGDPQLFLRPGQVSYVAQVPRVLSGTFAGNLALDHDRDPTSAVEDARLGRDVTEAGGLEAIVGHRGVRLSGGQVQRLALARALATSAELLLADDVSSALDAKTEVELWQALRDRGTTVLGSTSKRAALRAADRVVVLDGAASWRSARGRSWRGLGRAGGIAARRSGQAVDLVRHVGDQHVPGAWVIANGGAEAISAAWGSRRRPRTPARRRRAAAPGRRSRVRRGRRCRGPPARRRGPAPRAPAACGR